MSEMAIVSARKARLEELAEKGSYQAQVAIRLGQEPGRFLATVQIGITLIGIAAGAFGGAVLANQIAGLLVSVAGLSAELSEQIGFALVIAFTTYLSLVIGELVPKRIALRNPERIAVLVAVPMQILARLTTPLVFILSKSSEGLLRLAGMHGSDDSSDLITDYEIVAMIQEGIQSGDFELTEQKMVQGALELDDTRIQNLLTPRTSIEWLEANATPEEIRTILEQHPHSIYPVCEETIDNVIGVVLTIDIVKQLMRGEALELRRLLRSPLFVPESVFALDLLQQLKQAHLHMALVLGEHGGIEGLITITDIIEQIIGDMGASSKQQAVQRADGSYLVDGNYPIGDLEELLKDFEMPEDEKRDYSTVAGFLLHRLQRIPEVSATFTWESYRFEVMDMDGNRIDKILIETIPQDSSD
jgi:putative hemolysin